MRRCLFGPVLLTVALAACADPGAEAARHTFEAFQDALFAGDRPAIRRLLTSESRPVAEHLPLDAMAGRQRLQVTAVEADAGVFHLHVHDPEQGCDGVYVVARENGQTRVDLVATAGFHHHRRWLDGPAIKKTVRTLTDAEVERAERLASRR